MITVLDVMRELRIEITNELSWSVGNQARDLYEHLYGALPDKGLRPKTNDVGTHCFALYPESFHDDIERIILAHQIEERRQGNLFP